MTTWCSSATTAGMYTDGFQGDITWGGLAVLAVVCLYFCAVVLLVGDGWTVAAAARAVVRRVVAWVAMGVVLLALPVMVRSVVLALRSMDRWGRLS